MADKYWIGGDAEYWNNTDNWASTSGGAGGESAPITSDDIAIFDINSAPSDFMVIIDLFIACRISILDAPSLTFQLLGGGILSLQEDVLNLSSLLVSSDAVLNTNNYDMTVEYATFSGEAVFNLGESTLALTGAGGTVFTGSSLGSLVISGGTIDLTGSDIYDVVNCTIINNSLVGVSPDLPAPINEGNIDGGGNFGWDFSSTIVPFTISQTSGIVDIENVELRDSVAIGGATFNAFTSKGNSDGWNNVGWIFTGGDPIPTYSISGKVRGSIIQGVTINLTGDVIESTVTDINGNYGFLGLSNGVYIVIPSYHSEEYIFVPTHKDIVINNSSAINVDFATDAILIGMGIAAFSSPMLVYGTQQISAIGHYSDGSERVVTQLVTWVSSDPLVATIDSGGLILALKSGITFITATYGALKSRIMLKVEQLFSNVFSEGAATLQQIPISPDPDQTFTSTVLVGGKNIKIKFFLRWDAQAGYWVMSLADPITQKYYVDGIPLMVGVPPTSNLLQPYGYLGIGSCYISNVSNLPSGIPNDTNLGVDYVILWGDTEV